MQDNINNLTAGLSDDVVPMTVDAGVSVSDPLDFMLSIPLYPRFLFSMRDEDRVVAGCGSSIRLDSVKQAETVLSHSTGIDPLCFAAIPFDQNSEHDDRWRAFDNTRIFIPSLITDKSDNQNRLCISLPVDKSFSGARIKDSIGRLSEALKNRRTPASISEIGRAISRTDTPDSDGYVDLVRSILDAINNGSLTKAVAARRTDLEFESKPDVYSIYRSINDISASVYSFIIQPDDRHTFIGFTPERLFRLENGVVTTEAVAGTAPIETAGDLLKSEKDLHEHQVVIDYLKDSLSGICSDVRCDNDVTLKDAGVVSHLYSIIKGTILEDKGVSEILDLLHPTPAVCGQPKDDALVFIRERESFDRGLYAGAVGIIEKNFAEVAVAIRSMLICDTTISLFAGAGIVDGSEPDAELAEIESKIRTYLKILDAE